MPEPHGLKSHKAFHIPADDNLFFNMLVAAEFGKAFLINTGYSCYLTEKIYPTKQIGAPGYWVVFDDQNGERRILSYKRILNITVGMEDDCLATALDITACIRSSQISRQEEFTPHEKRN